MKDALQRWAVRADFVGMPNGGHYALARRQNQFCFDLYHNGLAAFVATRAVFSPMPAGLQLRPILTFGKLVHNFQLFILFNKKTLPQPPCGRIRRCG